MGKRYVVFSILVFIALSIFICLFFADILTQTFYTNVDKSIAEKDSTVWASGTVQEMNILDETLYLSINNKAYDLGDLFKRNGDPDTDFLRDLYYSLDIGDNIIIYKSERIIINGELYNEANTLDKGVIGLAVYTGLFLPLGIFWICMLCWRGDEIGYEERRLQDRLDRCKREGTKLNEAYDELKKKYTELRNNTNKRLEHPLVKDTYYCSECGSAVTKKDEYCKYCGSEVDLR